MLLAASLLRKVVTAEATGEWFDGQVREYMKSLRSPISKGCVTLVAGERPFVGMTVSENCVVKVGIEYAFHMNDPFMYYMGFLVSHGDEDFRTFNTKSVRRSQH